MIRSLALAMITGAPLAAGCGNPCQDLCKDMAAYAEDECGITVPDAQVTACIEAQAETTDDAALKVCRQYDSKSAIEEQWGCDELDQYFAD